jgi:DNA polymerase-1
MIEEINNGVDFHSSTAAKIFNIDINEVTKEMRRIAKAVNFGIVYGMSAFGLSEDLNIPVIEAQNFINRYFEIYPEIRQYLNNVVNNTMETGYTKTLFNRRRYIPEIKNSNYNIQEFGKRTAMNAPIQGTAADIMKYAMIAVQNKIKELNLKSKMVAQVHDELIIDCVKEEVEIISKILKDTMSNVVNINVLLDVDVETGVNWNLK